MAMEVLVLVEETEKRGSKEGTVERKETPMIKRLRSFSLKISQNSFTIRESVGVEKWRRRYGSGPVLLGVYVE